MDSGYSFLAAGHLYGVDMGERFSWPARSFMGNLDRFNASGAHFFMGLGDVFAGSNRPQGVDHFKRVVNQLEMPFYNTPGNHDLRPSIRYHQNFGPGQWFFRYGPDLMLSLDSERMTTHQFDEALNIGGQLKFLEVVRKQVIDDPPRNTFVFMHRLLWAMAYPEMEFLLEHTNESYAGMTVPDSMPMVRHAIEKIAGEGQSFWISGDIGVGNTLPVFYAPLPGKRVTFLAAGIADSEKDAVLQVSVGMQGTVEVTALPLGESDFPSLDHFGIEVWKALPSRPKAPTPPDFWERTLVMFEHHYFWNGVIGGLIVMLLLALLFKGIKKAR